jgi:predicted alpha/beta hydrolase family esterase
MKKHKKQLVFISGGMTFKSKKDYVSYLQNRELSIEKKEKWHHKYLDKKMGTDLDIIRLLMPSPDNAHYEYWRINFERYFPFFKNNLVLVGSSLGGIFLARYLSENKFPKKIVSLNLVCPPFDNSLSDEDLVSGFRLKTDLSLIEKNCKNINLYFSSDDNVVPLPHAEKYKQKLPMANIFIYNDKNGHFKVAKFPELIKNIKKDIST